MRPPENTFPRNVLTSEMGLDFYAAKPLACAPVFPRKTV
ncbi:hypothetical protein CfE428DRAFT_6120 [Chthoniobacter flavus Ellin428]|uniref:Uncharacterized protein n=1 Tax=Chthoniobacter flavus Ellin428 TaxID=497964 RepID=B4DB29_9BACT|nr:hypothetical protein CfE428DRAFT_6120 [Chthoniobacter flavus Ellin428]TCO92491.1 hypothetical protein EV701_106261 [Chthoniobacter flavus]